MTQWFRVWHGMPNDPKFRLIAKISDSPLAAVITVFMQLMDRASQAKPRGTIGDVDPSEMAMACDLEDEMTAAILDAMEGRLKLNGRLLGWERRQPEREDRSADRMAAYRMRHSASQATGDAPEKEKEPEKKQRKKKSAAPTESKEPEHIAITIYRDTFRRYPAKRYWQRFAELHDRHGPELYTARLEDWLGHGWNRANELGQLDYIEKPGAKNEQQTFSARRSAERVKSITDFLGYDPTDDSQGDFGESGHLLGPGDVNE